ncbi:MAG: DNA topoisomerase I [Candidatus Marsarchaeota archaeon]|nr:DNA topoisomerase I [Candidatus Marsarchaeota archaeon]
MNTLIIAEKPSVALRIAIALGNGSQKRIVHGKTSYFQIESESGSLFVAPAVGHLFTIKQVGTSRGYPILDVEWAPSYEASKSSAFTKQYLDAIKDIARQCSEFINACDYDIEGTVIGTNVIKAVMDEPVEKLSVHAKRMKFSTTTTKDLSEAFRNLSDLDLNNFYAGETRHMLDWIWGINLSRALTYALGSIGSSKPLSIGRVQGPTLALLAKREKEIAAFTPRPFWRVFVYINGTQFQNTRGDIFDKNTAIAALHETEANIRNAVFEEVKKSEEKRWPYPPFDLTSLQLEASRVFRFDPSATLAIAQSLYEHSYISYPRTSSQKLPFSLGLPNIIKALGENPDYEAIAKRLVQQGRFKPIEGKKTDEAHPAIFPTGSAPKGLTKQESMLYDLIARRFLACFDEPAVVARINAKAAIGSEHYSASGAKVLSNGWLDTYKYARIEEREMKEFIAGNTYPAENPSIEDLETKPPKRYTKASLIAELEKRELGTKATRASIVDTLFKRGYIEGSSISVTAFGMSVFDSLQKNCPMIMEESTTRELEEDMDGIAKGAKKEDEVLARGKKMLLEALAMFDKNRLQISESMKAGLMESSVLGICPKCGGNLIIRHSRAGKQFVACSNYPKCTNTYPLVQKAKIVPTGRVCEYCKTPIVKVIRKGMRPFEMDLDPNCTHRLVQFRKKEDAAAKPQQQSESSNAAATADSMAGPAPKKKTARPKRRPKGKAKAKKTRSKSKKNG